MPDVEEKTVDIDTTGPGAEVNIEEEKKEEAVETVEPVVEEVKEEPVKEEKVEEKQETSDKQQEEKKVEEKPKEELEQYSEGVQKRIAKLTKKWRESKRQKQAAIDYAKGVQTEHTRLKTRISNLEPSYVDAMKNKVISGHEAAQETSILLVIGWLAIALAVIDFAFLGPASRFSPIVFGLIGSALLNSK